MSLATIRTALAADLAATTELQVYPSVPNAMTPPCLVLRPDDPWVTTGDTYGSWTVACVLTIYVEYADYDTVTAAIEAALPDALAGLGDWGVTSISEPRIAEIGDANLVPSVDIALALVVNSL